ncbi:hypothetical protein PC116_g11793 [Phytophthora cactorum]|uniref:DUF7769 domain-containing protein n=1 Tax=Phytophthora cactorum TaxID=29920 RepID=A0A8T1KXW5_9STRA|nr:hypothetical protein Pcac1_g17036 [Phytophthora cactorum]KAG2799713.1 hypothetical protein PC112_g20782 [Phytophthora cactorum]KAG2799806.1 hypothetical protein PC111_g20263 [Phytophthora cactorum]KAG2884275.1 hypothetical protein PC114_g20183 [Phytophthora cactorum]KAG2897559.1 hypothetical protein PC117_g22769 [Phytophthora cactorum]
MPTSMIKELTDEECERVVFAVLSLSDHGVPHRGALAFVADEFDVDPSTVSRIWKRAREAFACSGDYKSKSFKDKRGRLPTDYTAALETLRGVELYRRSTVRSSAAVCDVPRSTLHRRIKDGAVVAHTTVVNPCSLRQMKLHAWRGAQRI